MNTLSGLRRIRWAVRATLTLGVAASVAANVLHADPNPISQAISAWPPLALLLTVELISRVPVHRRALAATRLVATAAIAGIAAWVSYWHMVAVTARYGETGASPYLLPISVDGLIVVASISLVELAGRIRALETPTTTEPATVDTPAFPGDDTAATSTPDNPPTGSATPDLAPVPAHLLPIARFSAVNHQQTTGQPITPDELAARMHITPDIARRLLHALGEDYTPPPTTAAVNGTRVVEAVA